LFDYLSSNNKLEGGNKFEVPGYDKQKVSRKMALELCDTDPDFVNALRAYGTEVLSEMIPEASTRPLTDEEAAAEEARIMAEFQDTVVEEE
jgi:hypothetical protein